LRVAGGANQVNRGVAVAFVSRTSHRLAVDCHDFVRSCAPNRLHPLNEALVEGRRTEQRKDAGKGIVRRDAVFQLEKGLEPILGCLPKGFHFREVLGAANDGEDGDDDDLIELMRFAAIDSRVR
jgi:hypothetical protein